LPAVPEMAQLLHDCHGLGQEKRRVLAQLLLGRIGFAAGHVLRCLNQLNDRWDALDFLLDDSLDLREWSGLIKKWVFGLLPY
jgi:hypothetical protein